MRTPRNCYSPLPFQFVNYTTLPRSYHPVCASPSPELVKEAIYLLSTVSITDEGCQAVQEAGAFDCLVEVVGQHIDSVEIREAAADLLKNIATDETIEHFCSNLQAFADKISADEATEEDYASIPQLALG